MQDVKIPIFLEQNDEYDFTVTYNDDSIVSFSVVFAKNGKDYAYIRVTENGNVASMGQGTKEKIVGSFISLKNEIKKTINQNKVSKNHIIPQVVPQLEISTKKSDSSSNNKRDVAAIAKKKLVENQKIFETKEKEKKSSFKKSLIAVSVLAFVTVIGAASYFIVSSDKEVASVEQKQEQTAQNTSLPNGAPVQPDVNSQTVENVNYLELYQKIRTASEKGEPYEHLINQLPEAIRDKIRESFSKEKNNKNVMIVSNKSGNNARVIDPHGIPDLPAKEALRSRGPTIIMLPSGGNLQSFDDLKSFTSNK